MQLQVLRLPFAVLGDVAFGCVIPLQIWSGTLGDPGANSTQELSLLREAVLEVFLVRVYL